MGPGPERQMTINLVAEYDMLYSINAGGYHKTLRILSPDNIPSTET
jgi:hypothetical protein